jgi:hypothetical protein
MRLGLGLGLVGGLGLGLVRVQCQWGGSSKSYRYVCMYVGCILSVSPYCD